jgi:hypothetical protein
MAAAEMTPSSLKNVLFNELEFVEVQVTLATTGDWVIFDQPVGYMAFNLPTGAVTTQAYATADISADALAAATALSYDGATAAQFPDSGDDFWIQIGSEILKVISYTATVMTVARGQKGTTAAAIANNDVIYVLNTAVIAASTVGLVRGIVSFLD